MKSSQETVFLAVALEGPGKSARVQRSGICGLCQGCYSSGVELKLTEANSNEI